MKYFFDFDRTVFDTESFKRAIRARPPIRELFRQLRFGIAEVFSPSRSMSRRSLFARLFGTYASHGRFGFLPQELRNYLYPDAVDFFGVHGKECTIVTYGVQSFITAKVTNALADFPLAGIVYTHQKKGRTIRALCKDQEGPFVFVDDAHFQLESVAKVCPEVTVIEIRRDGQAGDGRWLVIRSLHELESMPLVPR